LLLDLLTTQDPDVFMYAVQYFHMHGINFDIGAASQDARLQLAINV